MKKTKVYFNIFSAETETGSRNLMAHTEIFSCSKYGDAQLIMYLLREHYKKHFTGYKTPEEATKTEPFYTISL